MTTNPKMTELLTKFKNFHEMETFEEEEDKNENNEVKDNLIKEDEPIKSFTSKKNIKEKKFIDNTPPQVQFENLVNKFWETKPYVKNVSKNNELEVRFGTRGIKPLTKIDYDNVIRKLKSLGFSCANEEGNYMLRMNTEFLDSSTGRFKMSNIRAEINGFHGIQDYCKHNDIQKSIKSNSSAYSVHFDKKTYYLGEDKTPVYPVNFDDFNFRVAFQVEERMNKYGGIIKNMIDNWEKSKKTFRYVNRVTFTHPDLPIKVDISIVKSSNFKGNNMIPTFTVGESNVFQNKEVYNIELEIDNSKIGPGTLILTPELLLNSIRKSIKYVLMGLQGTNYPISYPEQKQMLQDYLKLIKGSDYNPEKSYVNSRDFIGPSSYTLQIINIAPINENVNIPNIRNDYTVTDKADGDRHLMYISGIGKIYLINTNMKIMFTGAKTNSKEYFNSLLDGEIIVHDKYGKFINLYAAFDLYYKNNVNIRTYGFISKKEEDNQNKFRLPLLKNLIKNLNVESIIPDEISPIRIECKRFFPNKPSEGTTIFDACNYILDKEDQGMFEYNTDGIIFTPASMGVGADRIGESGPSTKITWDYSFKWKPSKYNTIDFLVSTQKNSNGMDVTTPIFQEGTNTSLISQIEEYKTIILRCGFSEKDHGYINPCQDIIDDKLPDSKNIDNDKIYIPMQFYPTNPSDPTAGICNIMLKKDTTGVNQMFTEENESFGDNTIVEFRYDLNREKQWRWVPLRVRYDKTADLLQGSHNYGNAYHVANSNWNSIHNPITSDMLSTGQNIPDEIANDDVYYNCVTTNKKVTCGLRDFHNLYVKKMLITSVAKKGDTLIDYACGKGGDIPKWIYANLSFVFGIDLSKDNLSEDRLNGACARFLNYRKKFKNMPYALFVNGNSSANIRSGAAMLSDKASQITRAVFGQGPKDEDKLGKGVIRQYGKGEYGFNISSCQFALHYFFENQNTFQNYMRNVAECTKIDGYFIGSCYDGKLIFNLLKNKKKGESITLYEDDVKIWEIRKDYDETTFEDDITSIGLKISVYQQSINKMFSEYLVNFDYLTRIMENYRFKLINREDAQKLGLPEGSGLFSELFNNMSDEIKRNPFKKNDYGDAYKMTPNEKKISFLNRYFVYKKIETVNAEKVSLELMEEDSEKPTRKEIKENSTIITNKKEVVQKKPRVIKLNKKIIISAGSEEIEEEKKEEIQEEKKEEKEKKVKKPKKVTQKVKLVIES